MITRRKVEMTSQGALPNLFWTCSVVPKKGLSSLACCTLSEGSECLSWHWAKLSFTLITITNKLYYELHLVCCANPNKPDSFSNMNVNLRVHLVQRSLKLARKDMQLCRTSFITTRLAFQLNQAWAVNWGHFEFSLWNFWLAFHIFKIEMMLKSAK